MAIPFFRYVRGTDDGCGVSECLMCGAQWESRSGTYNWKWCPCCGHEMKGTLADTREEGEPKWRHLRFKAGKHDTFDRNVYSKQPSGAFGVETREVNLAGEPQNDWHLEYISDTRWYPHTAVSILAFVKHLREEEQKRFDEDQAERIAEYENPDDPEFTDSDRAHYREFRLQCTRRDQYRAVFVKADQMNFRLMKYPSGVTQIYNRP